MDETTAPDGLTTALRSAGLHLAGPLGAGAGGPRWGVRDEAGTRWVVTVLTVRSTVHRAHLTDRIARLREIEHEHVAAVGPVLPLPGGRMAVLHAEVAGTDLATVRAARGRWHPGEVVTVLVPLAGALAALHDAGLSHGDVAPGNVVLTPQGRAVLVDLVGADDPREIGTPGFAAPERAREAGSAGDVHAFGRLGLYLLGAADDTARGDAGDDDGGARSLGAGEVAAATARLVAVLRTASAPGAVDRPSAAELAVQVYGACPPVPVGQPDPSVLARLTLRRLGELAAADRTRLVTASTRTGRGRHRRRRGRRGIVLGCAAGVVLAVCGATWAATAVGTAGALAGPLPALADPSGAGVPTGLADAVPAAIRLTYARAEALAAGDAVRLAQVTVPGSPAARSDRAGLAALAARGRTGVAATQGGTRAEVRVSLDQVRLLAPARGGPAVGGCRPCARVLVVADVSARTGGETRTDAETGPPGPKVAAGGAEPAAPGAETLEPDPAAGAAGVVLVMRPTAAGWRVSDVEAPAR